MLGERGQTASFDYFTPRRPGSVTTGSRPAPPRSRRSGRRRTGRSIPPGDDYSPRSTTGVHVLLKMDESTYAGVLSHIGAGIEIAAGVLPSAACGVAPPADGTDVPVSVGGTVPSVLALTFGAPPSLGTFTPGVDRDYVASMAGVVTSTATAAALTVRAPSETATGHLVNGIAVMPHATDSLLRGTYSETLTFTLSATTP